MTEEEQKIAIAEACGWEWRLAYPDDEGPCWCNDTHFTGRQLFAEDRNKDDADMVVLLPNYPGDLDAMHGAVQQFRYPEGGVLWSINQHHLEDIVCRDFRISKDCVSFQWEVQNATAAQRAEAFLKTLNLWTE